MGNCLTNNKILTQDDEKNYSEAKVEQMKTSSSSSKLEAPRREQCMQKKVRFKIENNDEEGDSESHGKSKTVRIRVVMTQEELKRMLSCKDDDSQNTTLEQLLSVMKLRGGRISKVGEYDGGNDSWKPALESIPEDRLIK